ncbi:MAG: AgmX/PglI C-terminal domain-containing protein [Candidatus Uhrbacteria bacterium]|nr:AgmX/PglI C-terminal domain-containing protein [Candidatus Uhrbacteria bacterium]
MRYAFILFLAVFATTSTAKADDVQDVLDEFEALERQADAALLVKKIETPADDIVVAPVEQSASTPDPVQASKPKAPASADVVKAKGNKVEMQKRELDKEIKENAGVLGGLRDGSEFDGVFGSIRFDADLTSGIGGLIGAKGTQIGSGGLGSKSSGLGGGGTAEGLGGLGTKGRSDGSSGYGSGLGSRNYGLGGGMVGGDPIIMGALDKSLIDAVIKRHMNQIRYCYQRELEKDPELGGKVVTKFVIAKNGSVSKAETSSSTMNDPTVESCIAGEFRKLQFPKPNGGGIVVVNYPLIFAPG